MRLSPGFCAILVVVGALNACGKKDGNDSIEDSFKKSGASSLDGSWSKGCEVDEDPSSSSKAVTTFAAGDADIVSDIFGDATCTTKFLTINLTGQYAIGDAVSGIEGAKTFDSKTTSATYMPLTQELVDQMNASKVYGYTDWKVGKKKDIVNRPYSETDTDPIKAGKINYDIVKIDGNKVYFGDDSTGDGETIAKRPTKLATTFDTKQ